MNGFCPLGPCVTTTDEIGDPHNLKLKCIVNGITKQDSTTQQLVFDTNKLVSWCSQFCTLLPGDVILTGTPPGVGVFMKPPQFLKVLFLYHFPPCQHHFIQFIIFLFFRKGTWWNVALKRSDPLKTKLFKKNFPRYIDSFFLHSILISIIPYEMAMQVEISAFV